MSARDSMSTGICIRILLLISLCSLNITTIHLLSQMTLLLWQPLIIMTSHHVTYHVTAVSRTSSSSKSKIKETRKENQYKIRKRKENKIKLLVFKCPITIT